MSVTKMVSDISKLINPKINYIILHQDIVFTASGVYYLYVFKSNIEINIENHTLYFIAVQDLKGIHCIYVTSEEDLSISNFDYFKHKLIAKNEVVEFSFPDILPIKTTILQPLYTK